LLFSRKKSDNFAFLDVKRPKKGVMHLIAREFCGKKDYSETFIVGRKGLNRKDNGFIL
jgi:hypothetical protein